MNRIKYLPVIFCVILSFNTQAQDIFRTACEGNLARLDSLLSDNTDINMQDDWGQSLLHYSIRYQQEEVFDFLIAKRVDIGVKTNFGLTALSQSISSNNESPLNPTEQAEWRKVLKSHDYKAIATAYADYMIEYGRDRYGKIHTPLFMTVLNRKTGKPFKAPYPHVIAKPYAPSLRRDHKMRPNDRTHMGSNPLQDLPLYGLLFRLTELTGNKIYSEEANKSINWFLKNGWSPTTDLPGWGSHMNYHVEKELLIFSGADNPDNGYGGHEYNVVWPYWDQNPDALKRFAHSVWENHIKKKETGHFNRHSNDDSWGMEFPQTGSCFMEVWAREYGRNGDPEIKGYIQTLLKLFRSMRDPDSGAMGWCSKDEPGRRDLSNVYMNLSMATNLQNAAIHVEKRDPELAKDLQKFALFIDNEYLSLDYKYILDIADKGILSWYTVAERIARPEGMIPAPEGVDTAIGFPVKTIDGSPAASLYYLTPWFPGRSYAEISLLLRDRYERCEEQHKSTYRQALLDIADIYMSISPEVQFAQYPDNISDAVELLRFAYRLTDEVAYLHRADQIMQLGIQFFFDETSPLPKITNFDDWYESSLKNESSLEILTQMLELSLDLKKIPEDQRSTPQFIAERLDDMWHTELNTVSLDAFIRYGKDIQHGLYMSQIRSNHTWKIRLSDVITRIPSVEEADEINGTMDKFTGKGNAATNIAYGGFKDVPQQITLVIKNTGKKAATVQVTANLHDTYHNNGLVQNEKTLQPGEEGAFVLNASSLKWIHSLSIKNSNNDDSLQLKSFAFEMVPRSQLAKSN